MSTVAIDRSVVIRSDPQLVRDLVVRDDISKRRTCLRSKRAKMDDQSKHLLANLILSKIEERDDVEKITGHCCH